MTGGLACRILLLAALALPGCAAVRKPPPPPTPATVEVIEDPVPIDWRSVVTAADQDRLARTPQAWAEGLAAARRYPSAIAAEGALLDPNAALARAAPSPGPYVCRVVKLGAQPPFVAYRPFDCFVEAEGELLTMVKATGTQRPGGRLWVEDDVRMVFLGALSAGEDGPPPYGAQGPRDVAGFVERVGPFRWRLVVPFPQNGAVIDIYELVPLIPGGG